MIKDPYATLDDAICHANDVTRLLSFLQDVSSPEDRFANLDGEMRLVQDLMAQLSRCRQSFDLIWKMHSAANSRRTG